MGRGKNIWHKKKKPSQVGGIGYSHVQRTDIYFLRLKYLHFYQFYGCKISKNFTFACVHVCVCMCVSLVSRENGGRHQLERLKSCQTSQNEWRKKVSGQRQNLQTTQKKEKD